MCSFSEIIVHALHLHMCICMHYYYRGVSSVVLRVLEHPPPPLAIKQQTNKEKNRKLTLFWIEVLMSCGR